MNVTVFSRFIVLARKHWALVFMLCVVVGIYSAPHVAFLFSLPDEWNGVYMMQTPNEDAYLFRMRDIIDGHGWLGAPIYFEYKNQWPLMPPTGEWLYVLATIFLPLTIATVMVVAKAVLPAVLTFLIYLLVMQLTAGVALFRVRAITAATVSAVIVLGYDLVDYRAVAQLLQGANNFADSFLLWSRPVNPITGALLVFGFFNALYAALYGASVKKRRLASVASAVVLGLAFATYFFSWGVILSIAGVLFLFYLAQRAYRFAGVVAGVVFGGIVLAAPYWYIQWQARTSEWHAAALGRNGLFFTHEPLLNKVLLASFIFFVVLLWFQARRHNQSLRAWWHNLPRWQLWGGTFLLGGFWALNQQVITGQAVWPFHFVQYTIPLAIVSVAVASVWVFAWRWPRIWYGLMAVGVTASIAFGVTVQLSTYQRHSDWYRDLHANAGIFDWFNKQEPDCVALIDDRSPGPYRLDDIVPAYTHCNIYASDRVFAIMPQERIWHGYATLLRLRGVSGDAIDAYIQNNRDEAASFLYTNWEGLFSRDIFGDVEDAGLQRALDEFPAYYRSFTEDDFADRLRMYRLDFIVTTSARADGVKMAIPQAQRVVQKGDYVIFSFPRNE